MVYKFQKMTIARHHVVLSWGWHGFRLMLSWWCCLGRARRPSPLTTVSFISVWSWVSLRRNTASVSFHPTENLNSWSECLFEVLVYVTRQLLSVGVSVTRTINSSSISCRCWNRGLTLALLTCYHTLSHFTFVSVFRWYYLWVLNSDWDQGGVIFFVWSQQFAETKLEWAIAESKAN